MGITIIGGGLAGSEAAWQIAKRGRTVTLHEMRPLVMTKAHKTGNLAELVCSNSFRGTALSNAVGLLKEELRSCGSLIMEAADKCQVPAGGALAVDRKLFSEYIDRAIRRHPLISVKTEEVHDVPHASQKDPVIVATGPLTSAFLTESIEGLTGENNLAFFDAISPILMNDSLDHSELFLQSRYDKGSGDDYLNIPLTEEQFHKFQKEVSKAPRSVFDPDVEEDSLNKLAPFEGCMPIEDMIARGPQTLLFGPLKPKGLKDPKTGKMPFAVVQLRKEDQEGKLWNIVGMQTRMTREAQKKVFRSLPGLERAEFARFGSVHRNTFIHSPSCLNPTLEFREERGLFFAGQITGVEGYLESTSGGVVAGINALRLFRERELIVFPPSTAIGALHHYISDPNRQDFQPMNVTFGIIPNYHLEPARDENGKSISKEERRIRTSNKALAALKDFFEKSGETD